MFLLQMAGFPGSGKSTIAEEIRKGTKAILIDRDVIKSSMLKAGIEDPLLTDASYIVVFDLVEYYLSRGSNVIIDTSCYLNKTLEKGLELCKKYNAEYKYIECKVNSYEEIERRIKTRKNLESQLREATMEKYNNLIDKSIKPKNIDILTVNTTSSEDYNMDDILSYLFKRDDR